MGEQRRYGPLPNPPRDGDKRQARQRINVEVRTGKRPHPNQLPCADCGHVWEEGERRHEYDHYKGYAPDHHYDVESVCTVCHSTRDNPKASVTRCVNGHDFTESNTRIRVNGTRECKECRRARDRVRHSAEFWRERRLRKKASRG